MLLWYTNRVHRGFVFLAVPVLLVGAGTWIAVDAGLFEPRFSDTEAGFEPVPAVIPGRLPATEFEDEPIDGVAISLPPIPEPMQGGRIRWAQYWVDMTPEEMRVYGSAPMRDGPPRVGIQAGHWQLDAVPEELEGLRASSGARGGGYTEQETVLAIARQVKTLLEAEGFVVDLLPATVPIDYYADAFVSIHADGATSANVNGFKISGPRRDFSGKADDLVQALYKSYGEETGLREDNNITRRMSGYYAFNWRRYDHALHPQTPAAIIETGFMTSTHDRSLIVDAPHIAARGIANGILDFLR